MPILYFIFWIILNGRVTAEIVISGLLIAACVSLLNYRFIGISLQVEKRIWHKIRAVSAFLLLLVVEVFKSNIQMIKIILATKVNIKPQIVYFDSPVRSGMSQVALACSIILTPGTVVVHLEDGRFGVHGINPSSVEGIQSSRLVNLLKEIEGGH